jgi:hypothetical protein
MSRSVGIENIDPSPALAEADGEAGAVLAVVVPSCDGFAAVAAGEHEIANRSVERTIFFSMRRWCPTREGLSADFGRDKSYAVSVV